MTRNRPATHFHINNTTLASKFQTPRESSDGAESLQDCPGPPAAGSCRAFVVTGTRVSVNSMKQTSYGIFTQLMSLFPVNEFWVELTKYFLG